MVKAREFAKEQREKAAKKAQQKKITQKEKANEKAEPDPYAYKNTHAVRPGQGMDSPLLHSMRRHQQAVITEQDGEESEVSAMNIVTTSHAQATKRELEEKTEIINRYKRID